MTGLSDTLSNLARYRRRLAQLQDLPASVMGRPLETPAVQQTADFGANPGELRMLSHVPSDLPPHAPLVVVLHGCGQSAAGYAAGAGWMELAQRFGFALLLPEQVRANNQGGCFNWFQPGDIARGQGEAASVRAMVEHLLRTRTLDPHRVFVTGLSAGGAFANVMLATCPELFAAGAIVAGLPYGGAANTQTALEMMYRGRQRTDREWGDAVRAASSHQGPWPRVSVWHGLADTTVVPANGTDVVRQWLDVHKLAYAAADRRESGGVTHTAWGGAKGRAAVELHTLAQLSHGVPISARDADADRACGAPAPYILEAGVSSSYAIAQFWGLIGQRRAAATRPSEEAAPGGAAPGGVMAVITKALAAAGLKP